MMKNLYRILCLISICFCFIGGANAQVPDYDYGVSQGSNAFPLSTTTSNKVQWLYVVDEFNGPSPIEGMISAIYIKRSEGSNNNSTFQQFSVKMGLIPNSMTQFPNSTFWVTGMDQVLSAATYTIPGAPADAWIKLELDQPFYYDGESNIVVEMSQQGYTYGFNLRNVQTGTTGRRIYGVFGNASGSLVTGPIDLGLDIEGISQVDYNLAATDLTLPDEFCHESVSEVELTVSNLGSLPVDSFKVAWSIDGVFQNEWAFIESLDTLNGVNPSSIEVTLTNLNFNEGLAEVKFWVMEPNGEPDEVNTNDTITKEVNSLTYYTELNVVKCLGEVLDVGGVIFDEEVTNELVVLTSVDGCDSIVNVTLSYHIGLDDLEWEGTVIEACVGEVIELEAADPLANSYLWNNGGVSSSINVMQSGTYSVNIGYHGGSCTKNASVEVIFNPIPVLELIEDTIVCDGQVLLIDAQDAGTSSYQWSTGSSNASIQVTETGYYFVEVENIYGCTNSDGVQVDFYPEPSFVSWEYEDFGNYKYQFYLEGVDGALSYHWNFGDGNTSTVPMPIHQYQGPGVYTVFVNLRGLCTTNEFYKIMELPISIEEHQNNSWTLYPNPAQDRINLQAKEDQLVQSIKVSDFLGREVYVKSFEQPIQEFTLDLSGWVVGQYVISITTPNGIETKVFMVQE